MSTEANQDSRTTTLQTIMTSISTGEDKEIRTPSRALLPRCQEDRLSDTAGISRPLSRDNPFATDGELRRTADVILARSTFSRRSINIVDPDLDTAPPPPSDEVPAAAASSSSSNVIASITANSSSPKRVSFAATPSLRGETNEVGVANDDVIAASVATATGDRHFSVEVVKVTLDRSQEVTATYIQDTNADTSSESDSVEEISLEDGLTSAIRPNADLEEGAILRQGQGERNENENTDIKQMEINDRVDSKFLLQGHSQGQGEGHFDKTDQIQNGERNSGSRTLPEVDVDRKPTPEVVIEQHAVPETKSGSFRSNLDKQNVGFRRITGSANACRNGQNTTSGFVHEAGDVRRQDADDRSVLRKIIDVRFVIEMENQPTATNQPTVTNQPTGTTHPTGTNQPTVTNQPTESGRFSTIAVGPCLNYPGPVEDPGKREPHRQPEAGTPAVVQPKSGSVGTQLGTDPRIDTVDEAERTKAGNEEHPTKSWKRKILCCSV